MSVKISNKDRRAEHRIAIKLPITVISASEESWSEETTTEDVAARGVLCHLSHSVMFGERLRLQARLPDGSAIELSGRVVHLTLVSPTKNRVGVEVVGDSREWEQFFLAWLTDGRD